LIAVAVQFVCKVVVRAREADDDDDDDDERNA
jgi:hypothetical protein